MQRPSTRVLHLLLLTIAALASATAGCGGGKAAEPEPEPAQAPAEPKLDREMMLRQAAARVEAEREKKRAEMRAIGVATATLKKVVGPKDAKKIDLAFEFENQGDKELTVAEGFIVFRNAAGEPLKKMKVPFNGPIAPGKKVQKRGKFPLDAAEDNDHLFAKTPLKELKVEWEPRRYRLEDGTELLAD